MDNNLFDLDSRRGTTLEPSGKVSLILLITILIMLVFGIYSTAGDAYSKNPIPSFKQAVVILGNIDDSATLIADKIDVISRKTSDVRILINSNGGNIVPAYHVIAAINVAKNGGALVSCGVTGMAASMAAHILAHCDKRYVLRHGFILFHEKYIVAMNTKLTARTAFMLSKSISDLAEYLDNHLASELGVTRDIYDFHNIAETLWTVENFHKEFPKFNLILVDDLEIPEGVSMFTQPKK